MRIRPPATPEQRRELRTALARFQQPEAALGAVQAFLPPGFEPATVACHIQSVHPDRFVVQVLARSTAGGERNCALKIYSDDFGEQMWSLAQMLAERQSSNHNGLCLPQRYVREQRALVFPWVDGIRLSDIVDLRKPDLLRRAAAIAADFHRMPLADVPTLTPEMVVAETLDRCRRLLSRWPSLSTTVRPLMGLLQETVARLEPARPSMIHGDMAAGQFVWTGERLVLLDMDTAGLSDPAYDIGHFLGQLERRCTLDANLPAHSKRWLSSFREAYPAASLGVSWRNVSFYQGITLVRKMYTLSRRDPIGGPCLALRLAERARAAFEAAASGG